MTLNLTKSRSGSRRLERVATSDTVVLSPPGMIRPSHWASCSGVRTSTNAHFTVGTDANCVEAWCSSTTCSWNAPCNANTPIVILVVICDLHESHMEFVCDFGHFRSDLFRCMIHPCSEPGITMTRSRSRLGNFFNRVINAPFPLALIISTLIFKGAFSVFSDRMSYAQHYYYYFYYYYISKTAIEARIGG